MSDATAAARQWDCQQHVLRFFQLLDARRYDDIVALFAADGAWVRPASTASGRGEILAALEGRPAQRDTRHVVTNFIVENDGGGQVQASCLLTTYAVDMARAGAPALAEAVAGIYRAVATMRTDGDVPSFIRLELAPVWAFRGPSPPGPAP